MTTPFDQPIEHMLDRRVLKTIIVKASAERAFRVFTEEIDTWWPRTHNIGKGILLRTCIEGSAGGRCYNEQTDGTRCDWGTILVWEPPYRFVMAWQIGPQWQYEPDLAKSSEVEVRFTPEDGGTTRVDLEHRCFNRHGDGGDDMRTAVESPMGWDGLLRFYAARLDL
ncbi:MAG: SRPBCC family protein [Bryobacteraceae bacterium]|jgi:uncharacterized protein YndB with AHSA1/START domain